MPNCHVAAGGCVHGDSVEQVRILQAKVSICRDGWGLLFFYGYSEGGALTVCARVWVWKHSEGGAHNARCERPLR